MKAEAVYVDPSALARLYLHQDGSRQMCAWRTRTPGALAVTHHGRVEIVNALCRAAFVGHLDPAGLQEALADFKADFQHGWLHQANLLWRAALDRADALSRAHSPILGTRTLDVLHVACALELNLKRFLTFDQRQEKLAKAAGLRMVRIG